MDLIRVGAFELYPSERKLCAEGCAIELGARAFDLLLVLVENAGRLVTKATLLERVWPRLIVDENNLPTQIASLRRVLGASAIRTIPGFGYRLELSVTGPGAVEPAPTAAALSAAVGDTAPRVAGLRPQWPGRLAPLIGRDADVQEIEASLQRTCFVTVVGGAGVGKTRLGQEIFARATDGGSPAAWVSLEPLSAVQHAPSAIASAVGLPLPDEREGFAALERALAQVPLLLVLDGVEHLAVDLAQPLAALVTQTRGVRLLVTSQTPLGVAGETVYRLSPLPVPDREVAHEDAAGYPAVALFAQRAAAADRTFRLDAANTGAVASICRHLDGNPLALELAAARVPALGVGVLLERLDDRFRLLTLAGRPADPRHGALHAAFEWSYGLLSPGEQRAFNRLGAFAGSFSLEAAARCVADGAIDMGEAIDLIGRLVDRSLVTALAREPPRYTLLETARHFALEKLTAAADLATARARMAAVMLELLDSAYREYWSVDELAWRQRYAPELDNVRAAMDWASLHDRVLSVSLYGSAWPLFVEIELFNEARARFEPTVRSIVEPLPRARLARFWEAVATYDSNRQCDRARYAAELAATMHGDTGDARSRYYALMLLALNWRGDDAAAQQAFDSARQLEDAAWPARMLAHGTLTEGALLLNAGHYVEARIAYRRALHFALAVSEREALAATVSIVELDLACGDIAAALQLGRPLALSLRHSGRGAARLELLAVIFSALLLAGEQQEARTTAAELYELAVRFDASKLYTVLDAMAFLACQDQRYDAAARIAGCADAARMAHGQARRRPTEELLHRAVSAALESERGAAWHTAVGGQPVDELAACALALGLGD
jgi:predicted ATPase/DNA-binding winged helix-turn-helix (wHTH) protein